MKRFINILVPLLFLIIGVVAVFGFEFYFKPNFNTQEVVVANNDIAFKQLITEEDVTIVQVKTDHVVTGAFKPLDGGLILNKHASIEIKKGTQIYPELIDSYDLIPNQEEGEFIAPIPNEWLFAVPGSLRRTYVADFYIIQDKEQQMIRSIAQSAQYSHSEEEENENEVIESDANLDYVVASIDKPILTDIRIASVKDRSNREVTESEGENSATGVIAEMEIIATEEILSVIREQAQLGNKIYVVYKYDR